MKKAETGVGTLIIFIAMIMVSAVAANVLISTSTSLQSKALDTGKNIQEEVGGGLQVITISAVDGSDGNIENITVVVKLKSGSMPIKFNTSTITIQTDTYNIAGNYGSDSFFNTTALNGTYSVDYILSSDDHEQGYLFNNEVAQIRINLDEGLGEDEKFRLHILPSVGFSTTIDVSTPYVITTKNVMLYP